MKTTMRTHTCGELGAAAIGTRAVLCGWVHRRRDHGGLIFIDLRDRWGLTQVVFNPAVAGPVHERAGTLRAEYVLKVAGEVRRRPAGTENPKLATGEVELAADEVEVLAPSASPPFTIESDAEAGEEVRLTYRYLDLRRPDLQRVLAMRHRAMLEARNYFDARGFLEIETPVLSKSTPEGARDYLVPSRTQPGSFFALPQSPQLMKQLLMVAGVDRYAQICKCFRDEDLRADRQPEFTQIDMEMSFAGEEDVIETIEGLMARLFRAVRGVEIRLPLPRITHAEALERYGTDKPDLRLGMEIRDAGDAVRGSSFNAFEAALAAGGCAKGIAVPGGASFTRSRLDGLVALAVGQGAAGLAWFKVTAGGLESPVAKFLRPGQAERLREAFGASPGDLLLVAADRPPVARAALSALRLRLGRELGLAREGDFRFAWIVEFPLFTFNEEGGRLESEHHPFTAPREEDIPLLDTEPLRARASSYDLVLNGSEVASGSVRIHREDLQRRVFGLLRIGEEAVRERFGFFLEALRYGAPPHAGIAVGLDRLVMLMAGRDTIRDVICFPKTQKASCLMTGSPSAVAPEQLRELHIRTV
ncbi:MAG: aspartate--tRNA ligase [bacterium]|nr:aspartate--tRNA ligase [bacterium]